MNLNARLVVSMFAVALIANTALAQNSSLAELIRDPVYLTWSNQDSVDACTECHYSGLNQKQLLDDDADRLVEFSRLVEMREWLSQDKHAIARRRVEPLQSDEIIRQAGELIDVIENKAYEVAKRLAKTETAGNLDAKRLFLNEFPKDWFGTSNLLSRRICEKMGWDVSDSARQGYASFRNQCLTCHGGYRGKEDDLAFARTKSAPGKPQLDIAQPGISCNYCHQIGSNSDWVDQHPGTKHSPHGWRLKAPSEKAAAGMRDLTNVVTQTDLCFDCHIGNRQKNMFVTHQMYAAGHPPLPSIEAATFAQEMPPHWRLPNQLYESMKDYPDREQYFRINFPGMFDDGASNPGNTLWQVRKMLIGALVARKKSLGLFSDSAAHPHSWADYSLYDCAACHHELQTDSERQDRSLSVPGRPRQTEWPSALLKPSLIFSQSPTGVLAGESMLERAFAESPFGKPQTVGDLANQIRSQLDQAIAMAQRLPVTESTAVALLKQIANVDSKDTLASYDSARQIVWALQVIERELQQTAWADPQLSEHIRDIGDKAGIKTALPSGRHQFIYPNGLREDLRLRENYDSQLLFDELQRLSNRPK